MHLVCVDQVSTLKKKKESKFAYEVCPWIARDSRIKRSRHSPQAGDFV